jgi:hypothetical protein
MLQCFVFYLLCRDNPECTGTKRHRASPSKLACKRVALSGYTPLCLGRAFSTDHFWCACPSQVEGVYHAKRASLRLNQDRSICFRCALTSAEIAGCSAPSAFSLSLNQVRRVAPVTRLLRPNRGLAPRLAACIFGQIATDATLQACAYSGPIEASLRV